MRAADIDPTIRDWLYAREIGDVEGFRNVLQNIPRQVVQLILNIQHNLNYGAGISRMLPENRINSVCVHCFSLVVMQKIVLFLGQVLPDEPEHPGRTQGKVLEPFSDILCFKHN